MAHIEQEEVDKWLRRADHVLLRRDKLDYRVVQLVPLPSIHALLGGSVPVEGLGHVIGEVAHITPPPVPVVQESNVGVDVGPASPASRDNLVLDDGHLVVYVVESSIWLDYQSKRQLGLLEEGVCGRHGVDGGSNVLRRAIRIRRRRDI